MDSNNKKSILILVTGAGASQVITLLATPLLTRIYSPSNFGEFALFLSVISIFSPIVTGTYEQAVAWAKDQKEVEKLVLLSIIISFISCFLFALITLIAFAGFKDVMFAIGGMELLFAIPLTVFATAILNVGLQWCIYLGEYIRISIGRILQSVVTLTLQIFFGYMSFGLFGLLYGLIIGTIISILCLINGKAAPVKEVVKCFKDKFIELRVLARTKINYPRFMIPGQLFNTLSSSIPVFILGFLYSTEVAGSYALAVRVLAVPMVLLGNPVGDFFKREARQRYEKFGNCQIIFVKAIIILLSGGSLIFIPIIFFGAEAFPIIFGSVWTEAGKIASILAIMAIFQATSTPLAATILLADLQRFDMLWQFSRVFFAVLSMFIGHYIFDDYIISIAFYSFTFSILYIIHSLMQYRASRGKKL
jgi:O-antigen/teichoic acid export membrane protein